MEYKQKNKSNKLVDRRFGEGEEELSVEDKMMQRFILQKKVCCDIHPVQCPMSCATEET